MSRTIERALFMWEKGRGDKRNVPDQRAACHMQGQY